MKLYFTNYYDSQASFHATPDTFKYILNRNQERLMKPIDVRKCTQTVNKF